MSSRPTLEDALQRLAQALDAFEVAVMRRKASDETIRDLEEDVQLLALDRSRLANDLDGAKARADGLESANMEAARRIDSAMETIRDLLGTEGR